MPVLGIDCTSRSTNVGISADGIILNEINADLGRQQSSKLPLLVEGLLSELSMDISEIEFIAVAKGPGYYTGIRTGIAYAAALARALKIKVIPLSSLELSVYDMRGNIIPVASVIKARQNFIYGALYFPDGERMKLQIYPTFCSAAMFAKHLAKYPEAVIVGNDLETYAKEFFTLTNKKLSRDTKTGGQAALMGEYYKNISVQPEEIRGEYLREPDIGPTVQY